MIEWPVMTLKIDSGDRQYFPIFRQNRRFLAIFRQNRHFLAIFRQNRRFLRFSVVPTIAVKAWHPSYVMK